MLIGYNVDTRVERYFVLIGYNVDTRVGRDTLC